MAVLNQIEPIDLSKYIVDYLNKAGNEINHLKLHKLLYYIDAWHNVYFDQPLIKEPFEAWMHGPVVRDVWDFYKGSSPLYESIAYYAPNDISKILNKDQVELIHDVLDEYGDKTSYYLECLTHTEDPWLEARQGCNPSDKCVNEISKDLMKVYYGKKIYG